VKAALPATTLVAHVCFAHGFTYMCRRQLRGFEEGCVCSRCSSCDTWNAMPPSVDSSFCFPPESFVAQKEKKRKLTTSFPVFLTGCRVLVSRIDARVHAPAPIFPAFITYTHSVFSYCTYFSFFRTVATRRRSTNVYLPCFYLRIFTAYFSGKGEGKERGRFTLSSSSHKLL
jgi:hypothetical protein